jgi:hypothetical protein
MQWIRGKGRAIDQTEQEGTHGTEIFGYLP